MSFAVVCRYRGRLFVCLHDFEYPDPARRLWYVLYTDVPEMWYARMGQQIVREPLLPL